MEAQRLRNSLHLVSAGMTWWFTSNSSKFLRWQFCFSWQFAEMIQTKTTPDNCWNELAAGRRARRAPGNSSSKRSVKMIEFLLLLFRNGIQSNVTSYYANLSPGRYTRTGAYLLRLEQSKEYLHCYLSSFRNGNFALCRCTFSGTSSICFSWAWVAN